MVGIDQFERDLLSKRVKSGLPAARMRGKKLGRQPSQRQSLISLPRRCFRPSKTTGHIGGSHATLASRRTPSQASSGETEITLRASSCPPTGIYPQLVIAGVKRVHVLDIIASCGNARAGFAAYHEVFNSAFCCHSRIATGTIVDVISKVV